MGKLSMGRGQWADAAGFLQKAEESTAVPLLEICYRELGDYQKAYEYACKQRG
jgi:hypothetical protein